MEPPTDKIDFFSALTAPTAEGDATVATIRMYGPIDSWGGWWGISTEDVGRVLDALPESVSEIVLRINSPGGEVWEAMAILNMLGAHRARVVAVVDGIAASAASFIAASCDETVMSPGSQMMIHSPSSIAWGNAVEMRKTADFLDTLQESMIEVYTAKAGAQDWPTLLGEETWLTAARTVELGLADRVDVVPDAGTATTVGAEEEEDLVVFLSDDDPDAEARAARVHAAAATARAAAPKPPSSSEPGEPNRKENVVAYDELKAGFAKRLGVSEADVTDEMLFAALDEALEEQVDPTTQPAAALPAGTRAIDETVLAELQANARLGAEARAEQDRVRRDGIIATAMSEGRITATSRDTWRTALDENEERTVGLLDGLAKNTLPVSEIGVSDTLQSGEAALYASVYGKKEA
jgi:ATP-dependent protease ClpP protease subunit